MLPELTSLNIKIDRELKAQADVLFNRMGMNLTTAVNIFVRQAVQEQAIPFRIHLSDDTLSKSELIRRINNLEIGKGIFLTDEEFEQQSEDK